MELTLDKPHVATAMARVTMRVPEGLCADCGAPALFAWKGAAYCRADYNQRRTPNPGDETAYLRPGVAIACKCDPPGSGEEHCTGACVPSVGIGSPTTTSPLEGITPTQSAAETSLVPAEAPPKLLELDVELDHIRRGRKHNPNSCALVLAVEPRLDPECQYATMNSVGELTIITAEDDQVPCRIAVYYSPFAGRWVRAFDHRKRDVSPAHFQFRLVRNGSWPD